MKFDYSNLEIVRGDIELEHEISDEDFDKLAEVIDQSKDTLHIKLTLKKKGQSNHCIIEFINWMQRF
jgi:hypothetical protein